MGHAVALTRRKRAAEVPAKTGLSTKERLLEIAGEIFAEQGFDRTTAKEICARASANAAAVNYYFGGIDGLYGAVLEEAQRRFITFDDIAAAVARKDRPRAKLRALIELAVSRLTAPVSESWVFRLLAREAAAPSAAFARIRQREILPRAVLVKSIVSQLIDLPPDHPAVARASLSIIAPFAMLSIADRKILRAAFPSLPLGEETKDVLAAHFYHYALAGLADVKRRTGRSGL